MAIASLSFRSRDGKVEVVVRIARLLYGTDDHKRDLKRPIRRIERVQELIGGNNIVKRYGNRYRSYFPIHFPYLSPHFILTSRTLVFSPILVRMVRSRHVAFTHAYSRVLSYKRHLVCALPSCGVIIFPRVYTSSSAKRIFGSPNTCKSFRHLLFYMQPPQRINTTQPQCFLATTSLSSDLYFY